MSETPSPEQLYVDPGHRLPDNEWAAVVRRANEVREQTKADAQGGASGPGGIVVDLTARSIASRKYFPVSGIPTQLLVLHSAECPLAAGYAVSLSEWFSATIYPADPVASWQRFVDPVHRVRAVPDELGAWHASEANPLSIGWEQAGYARYSRAEWLTPDGRAQLELLAFDMAEVAVRDGIPPRWLTTAEVRAVLDGGNRSIKGFCTHRQIDPETRTDPGDQYPYELLMERITAYMGGEPAPEEDTLSADMPLESKDGKNVTLQIQLQSIDRKAEAAAEQTKGLPWFDKQVRERLALDAEVAARQEANIAALTEAVTHLAAQRDDVDGEAILAKIEAGMDKFRDSYQVTLQRVAGQEAAQ
jgi:hypothetical protein